MPNISDNIAVEGKWGTIEYATKLNGRKPALDFLDSLKTGNKREQLRLVTLFDCMANEGKIPNPQKFKKLKGEIWEFKSKKCRVLCFQQGNSWILTHGFKKQDRTQYGREIKKAMKIMKEHLGQ
jgi:hypothetical protein